MDNLLSVLRSRKFWMSVIGMLAALGVLDFGEAQQAELAAALVAGISAVYVLAVAIEDGLSNKTIMNLSPRDLDDVE